MQPGKVLFISHDAGRYGAQILILNLLRWFADYGGMPYEVLLKSGGELEPDFAKLGKVEVFDRKNRVEKPLYRLIGKSCDLLDRYRREGISLIYSNTITNGDLLEYLAPLGCPVITHVHELENYIRACGQDNMCKVIRHTDRYIAPSYAVRDNLVLNHNIDAGKIDVIYEFLGEGLLDGDKICIPKAEALQKLSIPEGAFVVGACGTTDWRKSPDLFVQLAGYMKRNNPAMPIYFLWVGGGITWELEYDIEKLGLEAMRFVPHTKEFVDYLNCMDVFLLTSRVDPYPLVCLEAANLGKPVICFDNAGGMPEFVEDDAGFVVPYLGLENMAEKIQILYSDHNLLEKLGQNGQKKVRKRHDVNVAGAEIRKLIRKLTGYESC